MSKRLWSAALLLIICCPFELDARDGGGLVLPNLNTFQLVDAPVAGECDPRFVERKVVDDGRAVCLKRCLCSGGECAIEAGCEDFLCLPPFRRAPDMSKRCLADTSSGENCTAGVLRRVPLGSGLGQCLQECVCPPGLPCSFAQPCVGSLCDSGAVPQHDGVTWECARAVGSFGSTGCEEGSFGGSEQNRVAVANGVCHSRCKCTTEGCSYDNQDCALLICNQGYYSSGLECRPIDSTRGVLSFTGVFLVLGLSCCIGIVIGGALHLMEWPFRRRPLYRVVPERECALSAFVDDT
ncbi:hypothetical protein KFL_000210450 [Klebsormidium nitens]|uniref:EGF-like domain-containing protein n=1 Tax=Klebsormidium nitens TaxID=105231 RepID=A0A1Y1HQW3_KLENI|nr:hypothetical protein KFL_000210450 [Klebsormidium nitens]|eukprot:GAQ78957.1 hypothetical protein KFL_000210450 [Klebsormidium nitens]